MRKIVPFIILATIVLSWVVIGLIINPLLLLVPAAFVLLPLLAWSLFEIMED